MKFTELAKIIEEKQPMKQGAGVLVFHAPTKEFLLQKRGPNVTDPGQHDFFGGGVDDGESVLDAAYRETAEEGGFTVDPKEAFYPLAIYGKKPEEGLGGYHIFLVVVYKKFPLQINYDPDMPGEVESADWMDSEALKKVHLHHRVRTLFADPGFKDSLLKAVQKRYAIFEKKPGFLQQLLKRRELAPAEKHARKVKTQRVAIRKNPEYSQEIINATLAGAAKWAVMGGNEKLSD